MKSSHRKGRLGLPSAVRQEERSYRASRREAAGASWREDGAVGLALSGGGIRSATFGLGFLQGLVQADLFRDIDYLSTVSGGGYIGSCVSSLLSRFRVVESFGDVEADPHDPPAREDRHPGTPEDPDRPYDWSQAPAHQHSMVGVNFPLLKRSQIHHLRTHGNFLITRSGAFTRETFRALGHTLIGTFYTLFFYLAVLALVAAAYVFLAWRLAGEDFWNTTVQFWPGWKAAFAFWWPVAWGPFAACAGTGILVGLVWMFVMKARGLARRLKLESGSGDETPDDRKENRRLRWFAWSMAGFLLGVLVLLRQGWLPPSWSDALVLRNFQAGTSFLLLPAAFSAGAMVAIAVSYGWLALFGHPWNRSVRTLYDGMFGIASYYLVGALLFAFIPVAVWYLHGLDLLAGMGTVIAFISSRLLLPSAAGLERQRAPALAGTLRSLALQIAVPVGILGGLVFATLLLVRLGVAQPGPGWWILLGTDLTVLVLMSWFSDFNRVSPHYFYRDRLSEAYLRTEDRSSSAGMVKVRDDAEMSLLDLHGRKVTPAPKAAEASVDPARRPPSPAAGPPSPPAGPPSPAAGPPASRRESEDAGPSDRCPAPYHLIVCALNLAGSMDLTRRTRKSDVFTFSRLYCGSGTTGFVPTRDYCNGKTPLARAMTISGAAAAPAMGVYTSFAASFVMSLFNVRLGYWMTNPRAYGRETVKFPDGEQPESFPHLPGRPRQPLLFWPRYLYREMFGRTDADGSMVNLSDGGHTGDNLGLYPLLQRRCRLIIACDASRDPEGAFKDLSEAIRMIDVDENVKVRINLAGFRAREGQGLSWSHHAVGRIDYPAVPAPAGAGAAASGDPDREAGTGWLLYLRPSLTGDEPAPVVSYRSDHPDFPHQTTIDQFYDDDQFESYRALGGHIADVLLGRRPEAISGKGAGRLLEWCRQEFERQNPATPRGAA
jgi:patatin-like phospholipase